MNRILTLVLLILLSFTSYTLAQRPHKQMVNGVCEITFPDTPKIKTSEKLTAYFVNTPQSNYFLLVQGFDELSSLKSDSLDAFYQGVMEGTLKSASTKGKLIYKKNIQVEGFKAIEFEYQSDVNPQLPNIRFQRCILLNEKLYNYCYWTYKDSLQKNMIKKDQFFASFNITGDKEHIKQYNNEGLTYNLAYLSGEVLGYAIILTVLFLLIRGVIRLFRKKRSITNSDGIS